MVPMILMKKGERSGAVRCAAAIALAVLVASCAAVGPEYAPPDMPAPDRWQTALRDGLSTGVADPQQLSSWWRTFDDPLLTELIERSVTGNLDLKDATARLREARARRGIAQADRFPTLDAGGSLTRSRSSEETGSGGENDLYAAGFDAGWEVDLFGGIRRSVEAADADLQATQENLRDVLVSLTSEVALNYVELRSYQNRLAIARANQNAQQETFRLVQNRHAAGLVAPLDVEQARYNLESTRSEIPTLNSGSTAAMNRLAVLLGQAPGTLDAELNAFQAVPVTPVEVAVGVSRPMLCAAGPMCAAPKGNWPPRPPGSGWPPPTCIPNST